MANILTPAVSGTITEDGTQVLAIKGQLHGAPFNTLYLSGTFGNGSVEVEFSPDAGITWVSSGIVLSQASIQNIQCRFSQARIKLTGSTTPSIKFWVL